MSDVRAQSRRPRRSARPETLIVTLNKPPRRGALLTLPDGGSAKVREVLIISGEKVILADRAATASALSFHVRFADPRGRAKVENFAVRQKE